MSKKEKKSKRGAKKDASSGSSSESSSSSSEEYSSSSESSSESDRIEVKRPRLDSASKKRKKKEQKKLEKKKRRRAANKITKEDFFSKSVEFRLWLMEEKKLSMDSMKTTKAKNLFKRFVRKWNEGKLAKKYYKGIDAADVKGSLTKYRWKFAGTADLGGSSSTGNSPLIAGAKLPPATFSTFGKSSSPKAPARNPTVRPEKPVLGPQRPPHLAERDSDEERKQDRARLRAERKKYREDDKLTMEELAPRARGHQAKVEKRLMRRQRAHSPEVSDRVLMGSGMDYEPMMARKRKSDALRKERTTERASTKLKEYQEKESAKMKALLEMARASKSKDAL